MTTIETTVPPLAPARTPARARDQLRSLMGADAALAAVSGLVLVLAGGPLSDLAGVDTAGPARLAGAFLLVLAVDLALLARATDAARQRWVPVSAAADLLWAAGSIAVAVLAELSGPGRALVAAQGVLVLGIGEAKLVLHRRGRGG